MKKNFLVLCLLFVLSLTSSANPATAVDANKISSVGYVFFKNNTENFFIIRKIVKDKNTKIISYWEGQDFTSKKISDALLERQSQFFNKIDTFKIENILVNKYNLKADKSVYLYDIVFNSAKNNKLIISISYSGKAALNNKEISSLMNEAESFIK